MVVEAGFHLWGTLHMVLEEEEGGGHPSGGIGSLAESLVVGMKLNMTRNQ